MKTINKFFKTQTATKLLITFLIALVLGYGAGKVVGKQVKKTNSTELTKSN